jgi:hypothetical protein
MRPSLTFKTPRGISRSIRREDIKKIEPDPKTGGSRLCGPSGFFTLVCEDPETVRNMITEDFVAEQEEERQLRERCPSVPARLLGDRDRPEKGDFIAVYNKAAQRWRCYQVWRRVNHRDTTSTITIVRASHVPQSGDGSAYAHWNRDAGFAQPTNFHGWWVIPDTAEGRQWVTDQIAIEKQDVRDEEAAKQRQYREPGAIVERMLQRAKECEIQANGLEADARAIRRLAERLRTDADVIKQSASELVGG